MRRCPRLLLSSRDRVFDRPAGGQVARPGERVGHLGMPGTALSAARSAALLCAHMRA